MLNEIPVVTTLSNAEFCSLYFETSTPVVIKGFIKNSKAFNNWSPDYLKELYKSKMVTLSYNAKGVYNYHRNEVAAVKISFEEAVEHIKKNNSYYIAQSSIRENYSELLEDLGDIPWIQDSDNSKSINLWFGGANCLSPLHYDNMHNFLSQVVGSKKLMLYPPADSEYLYPSIRENYTHVSLVDKEHLGDFPRFKEAHPIELILEPGDILYLPMYWWHEVLSMDTSISVNYWWNRFEIVDGIGMETVDKDVLKDLINVYLKDGISIDHKNFEGETNLLKACDKGYINIVKALLELGANTDIPSSKYEGETSLSIAKARGFDEIVEVLSLSKLTRSA